MCSSDDRQIASARQRSPCLLGSTERWSDGKRDCTGEPAMSFHNAHERALARLECDRRFLSLYLADR